MSAASDLVDHSIVDVLEIISDAVVMVDHQWSIIYVNRAAEKFCGRHRLELLGQHLWDEFICSDGSVFHPELTRAMEQRVPVQFEAEYAPRNIWVEMRAYPSSAGLVIYTTDTTKRRRADAELARREQQYRALVENAGDVIQRFDSQRRFLFINSQFTRYMGLAPKDVIGKTNREIGIPEDICRQWDEAFDVIFDEHRPVEIGFEIDTLQGRRFFHARLVPEIIEGHVESAMSILRDFTEKKQAAREIRESRDRMQLALQAARMGDWQWTLADNKVTWSRELEEMHGIERGTFDGTFKGFLEGVHPEDREHVKQQVLSAVRRDEPLHLEYRLLRPDGRPQWVEGYGSVIKDDEGRPQRMVGTCMDITARKKAEQELQHLADRMRLALQAARMGDWEWSWANGSLIVSPELEELSNLPAGAFGGTLDGFLKYVHPEDAARVDQEMRLAVEKDRPLHLEYRMRSPQGGISWVESWGRLIKDEQGRPQCMIGICMDITARKEAERKIQQLAVIVQASDDAMYVVALDGTIETWNKGAERLYECRAEEIIGRSWGMLIPNDRPHEQQMILDTIRRGEHLDQYETIRRTCKGNLVSVSLVASPVHDPSGQITGGALVARDIGPRKKAEEMRMAKEAADRSSQAKDQFLAVLSHELRTPLTPVLAELTSLERTQSLTGEVHDSVEMMRRNVEMEARLIDDLLDLTRISKGKLKLHLENAEIHSIVHRALAVWHDAIAEKHLHVNVELRAQEHFVRGDASRLQQVFWNLLSNAIKFTPANGAITLRSHNRDHRLVLEISDTGRGIDPEMLPRVFDAFQQGDLSIGRPLGGLGLGLAICRAVIEIHGGEITASSAGKGQGSTFRVELSTIPEPRQRPEESRPDIRTATGAKILLVEDHVSTAEVMARLLKRAGYQVTTAGSVADAIGKGHDQSFDLVVSDLGLPDGSGLDVMRQIKAMQGIKGISLSGYGMEQDIQASKDAGFEMHLIKPVSIPQLEEAIRRVMQQAV